MSALVCSENRLQSPHGRRCDLHSDRSLAWENIIGTNQKGDRRPALTQRAQLRLLALPHYGYRDILTDTLAIQRSNHSSFVTKASPVDLGDDVAHLQAHTITGSAFRYLRQAMAVARAAAILPRSIITIDAKIGSTRKGCSNWELRATLIRR